jgi:hypothetical protein
VLQEHILEYVESCSEDQLRAIKRIADRRVKAMNKLKKETTSEVAIVASSWSLDIAKSIYNNAKAVYPLTKEPNLQAWARDVERIVEIDKVPRDMVEKVWDYVLNDRNSFWRNQVRSGPAFRRHFEKIYVNGKTKFEEGGKNYSV